MELILETKFFQEIRFAFCFSHRTTHFGLADMESINIGGCRVVL